ncbi:MAG: hypothetical protein CVV64_09410 [Candidatus Wallbacteria bacterium HGW-Wallbacteria-1]|jgi:type II secretion system protein C|uniref:PDZ domain-containing protein n=1 Tax=Candidatus Wallbacteria bacterium HGW-Wallbacteria-1 TaxID=2013854 RepID=A0A2N1PQF4_9BACT|nr:MAG: hypothetical protein CVV64_09410 [Candidatus Wallbacteria bacterium HGW-Wallbacteria-1]
MFQTLDQEVEMSRNSLLVFSFLTSLTIGFWPLFNKTDSTEMALASQLIPGQTAMDDKQVKAEKKLPVISGDPFGIHKISSASGKLTDASKTKNSLADKKSPAGLSESPVKAAVKQENSMELRGTYLNSRGAFACIRQKEHEFFLRQGEKVSGWILSDVSRESVTLMKEGERMDLGLFGGSSTSQDSRNNKSQIADSASEIAFSRREINEIGANPMALMSAVTIAPHVINRKIEGFQLRRIDHPVLRKAGLRNGDIVVAVEGKPITSIADAISMAKTLKNHESIRVSLKRNGIPRDIDYRITE